jgi:hypothetical protein
MLLDSEYPQCKWKYDTDDKILDVYGFRFNVTGFTEDTIYLSRKDLSKALLINIK